ncbi:hypothetical protein D9613_011359 [Agrocybe pediades]|uniref:Uncharacterized protein n=1 Tax=Agrocybe pediades TaxID=84607 RepID=A0A8H4QS34_9AGAR|nr:hypothetical protein D9613_011359 [Agrocybe pediades]
MHSAMRSLLSVAGHSFSRLRYNAYTLFLFSKSDIKTTLIPVSFFAIGAAPLSPVDSVSHAIQAVVWIWMHLLHFNLSNQVRDPEEDLANKPWRPLPSGRITLENARMFRYIAPFVCMIVSLLYSPAVFYASTAFAILIPMYHELHGDQHWLSKNLMNAIGYACFATGATLVARVDRSHLDVTGALSIFIISSILATTIQAQDFQDVDGDKSVGRKTLPIVFPNLSRYTPLISLLLWSFYLTTLWEVGRVGTIAFNALAVLVGLRYYIFRTAKDDEISYCLYNVWLATAFAMPGYWRFYKETAAF